MQNYFKVLIADKMNSEASLILEKSGIKAIKKIGLKEDEICSEIQDYDGLLIRSATKVTDKVIKSGKKLKVIGRAGIGVDNIDVNSATENGVIVMNTPTGNAITTAEHAISLLLSTTRQIPYASQSLHEGRWVKSDIKGTEVTGKTLGIIGAGNIGSIVIDRAQGLKMKVIVYDPFLSATAAEKKGAKLSTIEELLTESDFVTIHTPLNDSTRNLLNRESFDKMKKGVIIVNCARGGIVNENDLVEALKENKVGAAALDVFEQEPLPEDSPLRGVKNLILTPHLGASTTEAQDRVASEISEQVGNYLLTGKISNAINFISLEGKTSKELRPYKNLCFQLGNFIAQIVNSGFKEVIVRYEGKINQFPHKVLSQWAMFGLLKLWIENVNFINSLMVAKERSVNFKEIVTNNENEEYQTLVTISVVTDKRKYSISGTLLGQSVRIVAINDIGIESELLENNIYIENQAKPSFINNLAGLMVKNNINIGTFHLGRNKENDSAVALIGIDTSIDEKLLQEIQSLPLIDKAKHLQF